MDDAAFVELEAPRIVEGGELLVAGLAGRFTMETNQGIPALWQRFAPYIGSIPGQIGWVTYGVCHNFDGAGGFDYVCAVEVGDLAGIAAELTPLRISARRYAVFTHRGHISAIGGTVGAIWKKYLPESGLEPAKAPEFERYDDRFDPRTGAGDVEIWIPVEG